VERRRDNRIEYNRIIEGTKLAKFTRERERERESGLQLPTPTPTNKHTKGEKA
jgi:hypothetical protein